MTEAQANKLANIVGGEAWQSGGGIWLVTLNREDGALVVFSGDAVCEYESEEAFEESRASKIISLGMDEGRWVIQDDEGHVFYQDDELELGWRDQVEAERQARYLQARGGGRYFAREQ